MGIIKRGIIRAQINQLGLYSKAEDVANKMRQLKGRGDDTRRFFKKQGVKDEEIKALGLDELFQQDRVTQQEILDRIEQNRVVLEEKVSTGPSAGLIDFDYEYEELPIDEAYGQSYINEEVSYYLNDTPDMFISDDIDIDNYIRRLAPGLDRESDDALRTLLKDYGEGTSDFDDLPDEIQEDLFKQAESMVLDNYDQNPVFRITLTATDQDGDTNNVADMRGASFSYSLVGNADQGYGLSGLEYNDVPPQIRAQLDNASIYSQDEAAVQLAAIANEFDDIETLAQADTSWGRYTLDGGENYQESRLSLPSGGKTKFRENVHFPDDINNVFHVRTKDREGPIGERILYVEELQSDWAQTGRKKGFQSKQKIAEAENAAKRLFEEISPLLKQIQESGLSQKTGFGSSFLSAVSQLGRALDLVAESERSLDAAGDVVTALTNARKQANIRAVRRLEKNFLDALTNEEKVDLYVRETLGDYGGGQRTRDLLRQKLGDDYQEKVEAEARRAIEEGWGDVVLLNAAKKIGIIPDLSEAGFASIPGNPEWNRVLQSILQEQESFLESQAIDPQLFSKIQAALDRVDPEGAKVRAAKDQEGLIPEAPFVLDTDSWNRLAVQYIFKKAAEEGYDGVSFAPGEVHVDRWKDPGLVVQYNQKIPQAIDRVIDPAPPAKGDNMPDTMVVDGFESKVYRLEDLTKDGESIFEKLKAPTTMFGFAPLPLVLPEGISTLQGLSPAQEQEQERKARQFQSRFPEAPVEESSDFIDALRGAGEVGYEAVSDMLIEPFLGMSAAEAAFEMGATPEEAEEARRRGLALLDFEVSSPTGLRYKEAVKGGLGQLGQYLMDEGSTGRTRSGMPIRGVRDPFQYLFQEALIPAGEAVTEGALGIISLDPRDTQEMERVRREAARPVIEAIQPI